MKKKVFDHSLGKAIPCVKMLLKMKITLCLILFSFIGASASDSYSQTIKLSLNLKNVTVRNALEAVENQSEFFFLYSEKIIDVNRKVDVALKETSVEQVLNKIFEGTNVSYSVKGRQIILTSPIANALSMDSAGNQQPNSITGKVVDTSGTSLPGVSVVVKGTTTGTITDVNGYYSISNIPANSMLQFTFVGMKAQEIAVNGRQVINVTLISEIINVDEVVIVGYGSQRKSDISGSVATVKADKLIAQPTTDLQGMLKGKVAGLYVTMNDARPGGNSTVLLRGTRSLKGENSPLYVVDGVALSSINELNINDVETISVLKDASSQAIYGARASNGVILITTKRGSNTGNKVKVSYNAYYSIQNVDPNFEIFSPEEYYQLRREAFRGDLATSQNGWLGTYQPDDQIFNNLELESFATKKYVNWTDYAFKKNVPLSKHDVSLAGGNEFTKYSVSLGYYGQDGIRMSSDFKRYNGKVTIDQVISKTFKTGLSIYYLTNDQNRETNSWIDFITFSPVSKIYDDNGELVRYPTGDGKSVNPLLYEKTRKYKVNTERSIINGYFEIAPEFIPGLKYKLNASLNIRNQELDNFRSFQDPAVLDKGYANITFQKNKDYLLENILTYDKIIKHDNKLNVTLMQSIEPRYYYSTSSTATQLGNDFFGINSLGSALEAKVGRNLTDRKMASFMGRINYSYLERYLLNFTMRADGSSVFGANNKWGYFPSAALAWNLHKESFLKEAKWLKEAKFRLSYGQIGNQAISPYGSLATADNSFYVSLGTPVVGYLPGSSLPNPNLKWETTTTLNTGVDFSILEHRLSGSVEYYKTNTANLLVDRQLPTVLGYSRIPANLGEIQNTGIEASLTGFLISNRDFNWSVTANFSKNKNKLLKGVLQDPVTGTYIDDISNKWFIGQPVNIYYDYKFNGIWQIGDDIANSTQPNARPGDVKVADLTGPNGIPDGVITSDDRTIIKSDPDWMGSISTTMSYKGFEFSADLYTVQGVIRNNVFLSDYNHGGRMDGVLNGIKQDYWTPENPSNTTFRPHAVNYSEYRGTIGYQDASYIRLRNVTLAYNLPKNWLSPIGLANVKVYVAGDNLLTWTDFKSYSPELDPDQYPETKNCTFGVNINF